MALGILWFAGIAGARPAVGQTGSSAATSDEQKDAMAAFSWMIGEWAGEGWIAQGPERRAEFTQTERITPAFGGRLILVEGIGRARIPGGGEGPIVHHAFGILSWNVEEESYRFDTYLAGENGVRAEAELEEDGFTWSFESSEGKVRFRIRHPEEDEWHETGEFSPDGGATWHPFFEMRLHRVEGSDR